MTFKEIFKVLPQYLLPQHLLSAWMSKLTHSEIPALKNCLIKTVIRIYGADLSEAKHQDLTAYPSFNDFFTRELKQGARPISNIENAIVSPADGVVSQAGSISGGRIFQAKNHDYSIVELLGGDENLGKTFENGSFATIYLSPKDYHRLHMPVSGVLKQMLHIPGKLFSVNQTTVNAVPGLFARNERVICIFESQSGPFAMILIGAIFVSSIETIWHGVVTPPSVLTPRSWSYHDTALKLEKGLEMGRFNMGSTVIVLFAGDQSQWNETFKAGLPIKLGEMIGYLQD